MGCGIGDDVYFPEKQEKRYGKTIASQAKWSTFLVGFPSKNEMGWQKDGDGDGWTMVGPKLQTKDPIAAEDYGCHCLPSTWTEMITEKVMKFAEPNDPNAANIKSNIMKPAKLHGGCRKFAHHHLKMIKQWLNQTYLKKWEGRCWTSTCLTCFFGVWKCSLKRFGLGLKRGTPKSDRSPSLFLQFCPRTIVFLNLQFRTLFRLHTSKTPQCMDTNHWTFSEHCDFMGCLTSLTSERWWLDGF